MAPTTRSVKDRTNGRVSGELIEVIGRIRRGVRRTVRRDWPYRPLTQSEVELLVLLSERPGTRVGEAADVLGLVPNTVSTLVGRLVAAGSRPGSPTRTTHVPRDSSSPRRRGVGSLIAGTDGDRSSRAP